MRRCRSRIAGWVSSPKLVGSGFEHNPLIYGYDYDDRPIEPAVEAFEQLAEYRVQLGHNISRPSMA